MDDISEGTAAIGESAFVDAFSISVGDIVTTTGTEALKGNADVDAVLGVELEEDKVESTGWYVGSSISICALVTATGDASLGEIENVDEVLGVELEEDKVAVTGWIGGLDVLIGYLGTYSSLS